MNKNEDLPRLGSSDTFRDYAYKLRDFAFPESQKDCARWLGIGAHSSISRMETGKQSVPLGYLSALVERICLDERRTLGEEAAANCQKTLLSDVNDVIQRFYRGHGPFKDWDALCAEAEAYRTGRNLKVKDNIGLERTLKNKAKQASDIQEGLRKHLKEGTTMSESIHIDSQDVAVGVYCEGLGLVRYRFWTTSYMRSGFWIQHDQSIVNANKDMLARVKAKGTARRLFLLERPISDEVEAWEEQLVALRRQGKEEEMEGKIRELENLRHSMNELVANGFEVRVMYDGRDTWKRLAEEVREKYTEHDTEVAIYDDFRVDLYGGGKLGYISHVYIFSKATEDFEAVIDSATRYYESLWDGAEEIKRFLEAMKRATARARSRLGYVSNYLAKFDADIDDDDARLKREELETVIELLDAYPLQLRSHLDIGTCTGRWLIAIRNRVKEEGNSVGIDNEEDAVICARARVRKEARGDTRIEVLQRDFTAPTIGRLGKGKFHLITCMLGTLSHFGWNRKQRFDDDPKPEDDALQGALCRMGSLLEKDGILLLSVWSPEACKDSGRGMLKIYQKTNRRLLAKWTPEPDELEKRLAAAGLDWDPPVSIDQRLYLYKCRGTEQQYEQPMSREQ